MNAVVVTGMGAVTPVGSRIDSMWENIAAGRHGIAPITRFDCSGYRASLAAEAEGFDPLDYFDKSDLRRLDLYSQYGIAAAEQAVRDSNILGAVSPDRFMVCFGSGIGGIVTFEKEHSKLIDGGPRKVSPLFIPMMIGNLAAGNIAIRFGANGSCIPVVTACATGTDAIGQAYRAIKHGYADAAIAGGSEAAITPMGVAGFANMTALSNASDPDAASLPFDKRRAGFVIGEGAGALVLESLEHATARGARIYAQVAGYGATCDAHHITAPSPDGISSGRAISDAFAEAGSPAGIIYLNAHGTGTPLNDVAETRAIKRAFGESTGRIIISSTKSMTGHMLGAAGAVEAIISILALRDNLIPPTAGLHEPDPECDLDFTPLAARKATPELAMSVSLGFGGHNACLAFKQAIVELTDA
ncbi:MAG: beta-ketoacyl-ACP synthase II [Oscillospiraceae bacterium]|nr:beta-ketoacyl-ACP synthase II [Oscillospiraceae bacterium]